MRSDRKSIEYTLYDDGANPDSKERAKAQLRRELLHVNFLNCLRNRNPGAMQVVVPKVDKEGQAAQVQPGTSNNGLAERLKRKQLDGLDLLKNREPKWNASSNMYQLDFQGRATLASCKNIQLHAVVCPIDFCCVVKLCRTCALSWTPVQEGDPAEVQFLMGKV